MSATRQARVGRVAVAVVLAAVLAACLTSRPARDIPQAVAHYGRIGHVQLANGRRVDGELLAVTDTAVVLLVAKRIGVARSAAIDRVTLDDIEVRYSAGRGPTPKQLERIRLQARFPFGIPTAAMASLLEHAAQSAPDDLEQSAP